MGTVAATGDGSTAEILAKRATISEELADEDGAA